MPHAHSQDQKSAHCQKRVLLIIGGGIAAYKCHELIRLLRRAGILVRVVLTKAGAEFVTPLTLAALSEDKVYTDLFSLTDEHEMGHIELSRQADLVVVAPATADLMAKMAQGLASDLATTLLLATDKPVMIAPAMNVRMWEHKATQRNLAQLLADGITLIAPKEGAMACGEFGVGRLAEPAEMFAAIEEALFPQNLPLKGKRAFVISGPTHEPIDPVRYIANRSSGKQGHAIAGALAEAGADVTLISGPVHVPVPKGVRLVSVETAQQMFSAVKAASPTDIGVFAAAVADWHVKNTGAQKLKKTVSGLPSLELAENPDILARMCADKALRPKLSIGFAAETENVLAYAKAKRLRKACDWLVANDVSPSSGVMGGDMNSIYLIREAGADQWPQMRKEQVAQKLVAEIIKNFET